MAFQKKTTNEVSEILYGDMLIKFAKNSLEMRQKSKEAYSNRFIAKLRDEIIEDGYIPTHLHGLPGEGKTSCIFSAAKDIAIDLELNFLIDPPDDYHPCKNDMIVVTQELSGVVSSVDFGGIPSKMTAPDGGEYMTKVMNARFANINKAGAAVLLLDDFANGSPTIQNVALSLAERGGYQGLNVRNGFCVMTSNLGSRDGTNVSSISNAMVSRTRNFEVSDRLEDFKVRIQRKYKDDLADVGILGFLEGSEELFRVDKLTRNEAFPSPRTWEKFIKDCRRIYSENERHLKNPDSVLMVTRDLQERAASLVGTIAAERFAAYSYSLFSGAEPFAKEIMSLKSNGDRRLQELSKESMRVIKQKMEGHNSLSSDSLGFGYQVAYSLANLAGYKLAINGDNKEQKQLILIRFAEGLVYLGGANRGLAIQALKNKLANTNEHHHFQETEKIIIRDYLLKRGMSGGEVKSINSQLSGYSTHIDKSVEDMKAWLIDEIDGDK
jgi:hypothetical protein